MHKNALPEIRLAALEKEVRLWLQLDAEIKDRLEQEHGWTPDQIRDHAEDMQDRDAVKERIQLLLADRL